MHVDLAMIEEVSPQPMDVGPVEDGATPTQMWGSGGIGICYVDAAEPEIELTPAQMNVLPEIELTPTQMNAMPEIELTPTQMNAMPMRTAPVLKRCHAARGRMGGGAWADYIL